MPTPTIAAIDYSEGPGGWFYAANGAVVYSEVHFQVHFSGSYSQDGIGIHQYYYIPTAQFDQGNYQGHLPKQPVNTSWSWATGGDGMRTDQVQPYPHWHYYGDPVAPEIGQIWSGDTLAWADSPYVLIPFDAYGQLNSAYLPTVLGAGFKVDIEYQGIKIGQISWQTAITVDIYGYYTQFARVIGTIEDAYYRLPYPETHYNPPKP
jgi:hypothetical protein